MIINEKLLPKLIIVAPIIAILMLSALLSYFYIENLRVTFAQESALSIQESIESKKLEARSDAKQIERLFHYTYERLESNIHSELKERVALAYKTAHFIYDKYSNKISSVQIKERIKDALQVMRWHDRQNYIWITDYEGNNILSANKHLLNQNIIDYADADGRAIILEEIFKVRKHQEGFIKTRFTKEGGEQIMLVKDFGHYDWFFGSGIHIWRSELQLKTKLYEMIQNIPSSTEAFTLVMDKNAPLKYINNSYLVDNLRSKIAQQLSPEVEWISLKSEQLMIHSSYFKEFDIYILNGFSLESMQKKLNDKRATLEKRIHDESQSMLIFASIAVVLTAFFSLLFSKRINTIFKNYQERVKNKETALQELNENLEQRIHSALMEHRKKDKMLIQQSKMAAMGDMISMIAHQWRQPLNQLSYVFMNIEGAYEYKELTAEYMDDKVKEGNNLLEFMSHTIDDFRNFFQPDKKRELISINEVCEKSLSLIEKSLDTHNIKIETNLNTHSVTQLYRNELMQVLLNIINNAKDIILSKNISEGKISIKSSEDTETLYIEICDNAGGVDEKIIDKIFEPYFTTKDVSSGTGLGLYMSQTIIQTHFKGRLRISNTTEGACFLIQIPKY